MNIRGAGAVSAIAASSDPSERERIATLAAPALNWFVLAALAYRALITVIMVANNLSVVGSAAHDYIVATVVLVTADLIVLAGVASGPFRWLLRSNAFFVADLLVTTALNLWAASILPHATFFLPGRDVFWFYGAGTIGLWTSATLASYLLTSQIRLTERQKKVLQLVASGESDQDIAEQLFISLSAVHGHLEKIRAKTGLHNRVKLTHFAIKWGYVPRPSGKEG